MKLLREIQDQPFPSDLSTVKIREASRGVLFDENNLVPLLFVEKYRYHKLPGGGIDPGEDREAALRREILEEVGSTIEITEDIGEIREFRSQFNLRQISYAYIGKILSKGLPTFTKKEREQNFKLLWLPLELAISAVENDRPENYEGIFIQQRDVIFLKKAQAILQN